MCKQRRTRLVGVAGILVITLASQCLAGEGGSTMRLWYKQPAEKWTDALPVGNGRMGAMVFGRVGRERIQLNEESLWAGSKIDNNNPGALEHLAEIQRLLLEGRNIEAAKLAERHLAGTPPRTRSYQPLGDLILDFGADAQVTEYRRELDLETGISAVSYRQDGVVHRRACFVSAPDDVVVVRITAGDSGGINATIRLERERDARVTTVGASLVMTGQIIDEDDRLRGPGGAHMRFAAKLAALNEGGSIKAVNGALMVEGADALTLIFTGATDYAPTKMDYDRAIEPLEKCEALLSRVEGRSFDQLKQRHVQDHRALFSRMQIDLGESPTPDSPTDERLAAVKAGADDPALVALYFQYGRYLLMGSSRKPGVLPANLQGVWNEHLVAPWNSDYHTNINLQMNYWPALVCNLAETMTPLVNFVDRLRVPGRVTAQKMYGARGWTMHHGTDVFGRTAVQDAVRWGMLPLGAAWMTFPVWRYYQYTGDEAYLRDRAYPILKEAVRFVLDFLIEDADGRLVTAPSYSPENTFYLPGTRQKAQLSHAPTMDIQIITELFTYCLQAIKVLGADDEFGAEIRAALAKLPPVQIGRDGTIQEWIEEYEEAEPGHRHMSHLLGLHPGSQITRDTPAQFEAARKTIERRLAHGGGHTGWSRAWMINFYARLLDGEAAHEHVMALLRKSTLPNLFDDHPPFQIDGNFGGTAGIAEMLVQSHAGEIHLLPALPSAWPTGKITGLCARGGFVVDLEWRDGALREARLLSKLGKSCRLQYGDRKVDLETEPGQTFVFDGNLTETDSP